MDSVGQDVENIDVVLDNYTSIDKFGFVDILEEAAETLSEEFTYNRDASDEDNLEAYKSLIKEQDSYNPESVQELEDSPDGKLLVTTTPEDETLFILSLNHQPITQKIFDTIYTGLLRGKIEDFDGFLLTRVEDDSPEFELDSLDSDKENVTIEEAEED